jgi:glutamate 5-kinase
MKSKVQAATWALENDCSVVICNGGLEDAIVGTINGKRIGTFFSTYDDEANLIAPIEMSAIKGTRCVKLS